MPHLFRTTDGVEWRPGRPFPVTLPDGVIVEATWAGCAQYEKLDWWLKQPGNQLAQSAPVAAIAIKAEDTGELRWGDAPPDAHLLFVLEPAREAKAGGTYRLGKMVTIAATPEQFAWFRDERFASLAKFSPSGEVEIIPPLLPPIAPAAPASPIQGELF